MIELTTFGVLLQTLKKTRTASEKQKLLKYHNDDKTLQLWDWMLNPLTTFGITDIPHPDNKPNDGPTYSTSWAGLCCLIRDLQTRAVTGHDASFAVRQFYEDLQSAESKLAFTALIQRRPDCGVNASTLNKAFPNLIPQFQASLAQPYNEAKVQKIIDDCGYCLVEPKYDGERRLAITTHRSADAESYYGVHARMFSRNGREDTHVPAFTDMVGDLTCEPGLVVDGELWPLDNDFARMASIMRSKEQYTLDEANLCFIVFDILNIREWDDKRSVLTQVQRTNWIDDLVRRFKNDFGDTPFLMAAPSAVCRSVDEVDDYYLKTLDTGLEGVIIKRPDAPYAFKRSWDWIKRKMEATVDLVVENLLPGDPGKQFERSLGRLVCTHNNVTIHVSPGKMSHEERQLVWDTPHTHIGRTIEVAFQEETPDGSLRHPRFHRWRDDK